jgi:hypothetical protein
VAATDDASVTASVTCYSYTYARRYPMVIGKIGGFALPTPLSPSQVVTLLGSFLGLLATRRWWGILTPGLVDAVFLIVVSGGLTWAVRHLRMEGRSPFKMLVGVITLAAAPRGGVVRGRQVWATERPQRLIERIYIVGDTTTDAGASDRRLARIRHLTPRSPVAASDPLSPWSCLS